MRLRPFIPALDLDIVVSWITDQRTHALWSGNRIPFPAEGESFLRFFGELAVNCGDTPFTAIDDSGRQAGFFSFSLNTDTGEGMLKFVVVDPALRGQGVGRKMLALAVRYGFEIAGADAVQLMVFSANVRAIRCYEAAGFALRHTEYGAFRFGDELWDRCNMVIRRE